MPTVDGCVTASITVNGQGVTYLERQTFNTCMVNALALFEPCIDCWAVLLDTMLTHKCLMCSAGGDPCGVGCMQCAGHAVSLFATCTGIEHAIHMFCPSAPEP